MNATATTGVSASTRIPGWVLSLIPTAVAIAVYYPMLDNFFWWDDFAAVQLARTTAFGSAFTSLESVWYFRPVLGVYYQAAQSLFGLHPQAYLGMNLALHSLNTYLVYSLARKVLQSTWLALLAAVLFATLSSVFETVMWIASIGHLLAASFSLVAALCVWDAVMKDDHRSLRLGVAAIATAAALFSKESAVVAPPVLMLSAGLSVLRSAPERRSLARSRWLQATLALGLVWGLYLVGLIVMYLTRSSPIAGGYSIGPHGISRLVNSLAALIVPTPLLKNVYQTIASAGFATTVWLAALAAAGVAMGGLGLWIVLKRPPGIWDSRLALFAVWAVVFLVPPSFFRAAESGIGSAVAPRHMYMSGVGLSLGLALSAQVAWTRLHTNLGKSALFAVLALWIGFQVVMLRSYDDIRTWMGDEYRSLVVDRAGNLRELTPDSHVFIQGRPDYPDQRWAEEHPLDSPLLLYFGVDPAAVHVGPLPAGFAPGQNDLVLKWEPRTRRFEDVQTKR